MPTARIVRGDVLALKEREFVLTARSISTSNTRLILRHILPNVMSPIMVSATLGIANAIITESALSFLGLGFPPDFPTWGRLLNDAADYLQQYPKRVFWPGLAISLTVLSVNYLGNGLRDALDPRIHASAAGKQPSFGSAICNLAGHEPSDHPDSQIFLRMRRTAIHTNATTGKVMNELSIVLLTPKGAAIGYVRYPANETA